MGNNQQKPIGTVLECIPQFGYIEMPDESLEWREVRNWRVEVVSEIYLAPGKDVYTTPPAQPAPVQEPVAWVDWVNAVMSQAQVFASTWSLVGGRFDDGSAYDQAEEAKQELRTMLANPPAAPVQPVADRPAPWHHGILKAHPESQPAFWPDHLRLKYMTEELEQYRAAFAAQPAPVPEGSVSKGEYNRLRDNYNDLVNRSEQDAKDAKQWRAHVKHCQLQGVDLDYQMTTPPAAPVQKEN